MVSDFRKSVWSVPSISVAVLVLTNEAKMPRPPTNPTKRKHNPAHLSNSNYWPPTEDIKKNPLHSKTLFEKHCLPFPFAPTVPFPLLISLALSNGT